MAQVLEYARLRGWHWFHDNATNAPRRCVECGAIRKFRRNAAGWLDLVLVRRPRLVFAELKREGEQPTEDQQAWIDELRACGQEVYVWKPNDWPEVEGILL
jgi:hypothetical protein